MHEELRVLSYAGNPDRFHEVNERFHNTIYAGSQNTYIAEMTLATRVRVQPLSLPHTKIKRGLCGLSVLGVPTSTIVLRHVSCRVVE